MTYKEILSISLKITGILFLVFAINSFTFFLEYILNLQTEMLLALSATIRFVIPLLSFWLLVFRTKQVSNLISDFNESGSESLSPKDLFKVALTICGILLTIFSGIEILSSIIVQIRFDNYNSWNNIKVSIIELLTPSVKFLLGYVLLLRNEKIWQRIEKL